MLGIGLYKRLQRQVLQRCFVPSALPLPLMQVRAGQPIDNEQLVKFAALFNDELTLDNLSRAQLAGMCQFVGITPFGTDTFLRNRLRAQLSKIKQDDFDIQAEGIASLNEDELRTACRDRGLRAPFGEGAVKFMSRCSIFPPN